MCRYILGNAGYLSTQHEIPLHRNCSGEFMNWPPSAGLMSGVRQPTRQGVRLGVIYETPRAVSRVATPLSTVFANTTAFTVFLYTLWSRPNKSPPLRWMDGCFRFKFRHSVEWRDGRLAAAESRKASSSKPTAPCRHWLMPISACLSRKRVPGYLRELPAAISEDHIGSQSFGRLERCPQNERKT